MASAIRVELYRPKVIHITVKQHVWVSYESMNLCMRIIIISLDTRFCSLYRFNLEKTYFKISNCTTIWKFNLLDFNHLFTEYILILKLNV